MIPFIEFNAEQARLKTIASAGFEETCSVQNLNLGRNYFEVLFCTACWLSGLIQKKSKNKGPLSLAISGAQGSGKTTFAGLLADLLESCLGCPALLLSLDDFYLTQREREALSRSVHPLLATRGVPGTHDLDMLQSVIRGIGVNQAIVSPRFSKAEDDRAGERILKTDHIKVVLFEGWCWGAEPVSPDELLEPVNELEASEDPDCRWRRFVNDELRRYQAVFETDVSIFLAVPDMAAVFQWRLRQEEALAGGAGVMDQAGVRRFIMHYDRLTQRMLQNMPDKVDLCLQLDNDHEFVAASLAGEVTIEADQDAG